MSFACVKASAARSPDLPDRRLLLDSHSFVWSLTEPARLPQASRLAIEDVSRTVLLSTSSIWEIAAKVRLGRWPEAAPVIDGLTALLTRAAITALPVSVEHARAAGMLDWDHRDPFDRMLAAQAIVERATLVTADRAFASMPAAAGLRTLWG